MNSGDLKRDQRFLRKMKNLMAYFAAQSNICNDPCCTERQCIEFRNQRSGANHDNHRRVSGDQNNQKAVS